MQFDSDRLAFIRANLPLVPVPGIPEIRLHQATPASGLHRMAAASPGFDSPYWAFRWAGGLALARYLLDHHQAAAGKRVLDLGTGGGLVAIAAALTGATTVAGSDVDGNAVAALWLNAEANGVAVTPRLGDLLDGPTPSADLVTVGDLFYDRATARRATAWLDRCRLAGIEVLIGDPWRDYLPVDRLVPLARYEVIETSTARQSGVFAFD